MIPPNLTSWIRAHPLVAAIVIVAVPSGTAIFLAPFADVELKKTLYTGAVTLIFVGLLGGLLKILLDGLSAAQRKREDAVGFVSNVLSDLKSVYDRVGRARILIPAHQSVKTYGDEMRDLIEARVQLRNVMRALERRADGITEETRQGVMAEVNQMEEYLEQLTVEFRDNYKELSDRQRAYETHMDTLLKQFVDTGGEDAPPITNNVWQRLKKLPILSDFFNGQEGSTYKKEFEHPLDEASGLLRRELARILADGWRVIPTR